MAKGGKVIGRIEPAPGPGLRMTRGDQGAIDVTFTGRDLAAAGAPSWQELLEQLAVDAMAKAAADGRPTRLWAMEKHGHRVEAVLHRLPDGDLELRVDVDQADAWFWHRRYPAAAIDRLVADAESRALQFQAKGWAPA